MMSVGKHKEKIKVKFIGQNSIGVTGSLIYVEYKDTHILLECGLYQEGTILENYQINKEVFKSFNPRNIDYCFILHGHIDHQGNLPGLIKNGFTGKVITTPITAKLMKPLLLDSAHIHLGDAKYLSKKKDREYEPLYIEDDVYETFNYIYEYGYDEIYKLDDTVSFRFLHNSHILGAAQLELIITKDAGNKETIFYSSDIGNTVVTKPFVGDMEYIQKASVSIFESTYGLSERSFTKKDRNKDIEKIKTLIQDVIVENKGQILVPCFSMDRSQHMMYILYNLFKEIPQFKDIKVFIDSPLTKAITDIYSMDGVLSGADKEIFDEILNWDNIRFITDRDESKANIQDNSPKIVIAASGFLDKGRSRSYLKQYLPNSNNAILFVGYATENSLAGKIKNNTEQKTITIDDKVLRIRAKIVCLKTYSSHMQHEQLVEYITNINCPKIVLVHGDEKAKLELKSVLEERFCELDKTTRVACGSKGMSISL